VSCCSINLISMATETTAPAIGKKLGATKWLCSTRSRRSTSTATFTSVNTESRSITVAWASSSRVPIAMSTAQTAVVKTIAT
jgi:hypothetical protein